LFQYAAALVLRGALDKAVFLPPPEYNKHSGRDYRSILYRRIPSVKTYEGVPVIPLSAYTAWTVEQFRFEGPVALRGYFQYLPVIESVIPTISNDLIDFMTPYREYVRKKYFLRDLIRTGFVHVRRGDYTEKPEHFLQDQEYYETAFTLFSKVNWFILSDDVEWCKKQPFFANHQIINEPDELVGLAFMSLCHGGAIIANSTYSWWGAMLGANDSGSPVVYPSKWLDNAKPNLFPNGWIRL
jgi:hypothetical protein